MTVPSDGSPRRLFEQSTPAGVGSASGRTDPAALRQLVETVVQEMLTREFTQFLGAAPYERSDARRGVRNETRRRTLVTRVGRLVREVPRDRAGCFSPIVFAPYQRHEQALLCTLTECYLQGVSTRKVRHVVETLRGESVSAATKRLDTTLAAWRARRLDAQRGRNAHRRMRSGV